MVARPTRTRCRWACVFGLKATFDICSYTPTAQIFLKAFKKYGMILADNGGKSSTLYFQSEQNPAWSDDEINDLKRVRAVHSAFEARRALDELRQAALEHRFGDGARI